MKLAFKTSRVSTLRIQTAIPLAHIKKKKTFLTISLTRVLHLLAIPPKKQCFFSLVSCDIDNVRCVGGVLACGFRGDIIAERLEETVNENGQNIANVRKIIPLLLRACYQQEGMDFWKVIKFECLRSATKY